MFIEASYVVLALMDDFISCNIAQDIFHGQYFSHDQCQ